MVKGLCRYRSLYPSGVVEYQSVTARVRLYKELILAPLPSWPLSVCLRSHIFFYWDFTLRLHVSCHREAIEECVFRGMNGFSCI